MRAIHIVDDDEPCRTFLRRLLSPQSDLIIRCFKSGDAFLADDHDAGVLLLDLHMPGASGMDVLATAGARHAAVVMSGGGDIGLAVEAMKAGALDFVEKPFEAARLLGSIEAAFRVLEQSEAAARRARAARDKITSLSPREGDVFRGLIDGRPNKAIADALDLSPRTVEIHRANLMEKLSARSVPEAMRIAFAAGMFAD